MENRRLELIKADITTLDVDAIVNAANKTLLGGGGVDGAIHRAAGPGLLEECKSLNGCPTGQAKITGGYNLKARHIIHTVGPVWSGGMHNEYALLASCYRTVMALAEENNLSTVAIPCISTGIYGFPQEEAAKIAINETTRSLQKNKFPEKVIFVVFSDESYKIYRKLLDQ